MKDVTKIIVNGHEYASIEQMPADVREEYLLALRLMGGSAGTAQGAVTHRVDKIIRDSIVYDGKTYASLDELPPEVREALAKLSTGDDDSRTSQVEVITKTVPIETRIISGSELNPEPSSNGARLAWTLVAVLGAAVLILLVLWLLGIRPVRLLRW